jgi:AcrR family transcriptional regulator
MPDIAPRDGRQARWDSHKEERRQRIIAAAVAVAAESEPGAEIHVQEIAERAGLSRTVLYRHFADRADLDRAVQAEILDGLWAELLPAISLDGTAPQIIHRIASTYVNWAVAHPALHRLADHDVGNGHGPLEEGLDRVAGDVSDLITVALTALGIELDEDVLELIDPLVYGLVGSVFSAVRRWITRPERTLSADALITVIANSLWAVISDMARQLGVDIDPDLPLDQVLAGVELVQ